MSMSQVSLCLLAVVVFVAESSSCDTHDCIRNKVQDQMKPMVMTMIQHAFSSYINSAFPMDEVRPIAGGGQDTLGSYALTLIDSLDLLALCGMHDEFRRYAHWVETHVHFDIDKQVSVFETSIRILGGLLSSHFMYEEGVVDIDPAVHEYDGGLLRLAVDLGGRLLPAFDTQTGIPYGSINLRHGVPHGEIDVTSTAGGGTFLLEMTILSAVTQDSKFENAARRATIALVQSRASATNLVGNHINISSGQWTLDQSSVGSGVDSLLEYLIKGYALTGDPLLYKSYMILHDAFAKHTRRGPWFEEMTTNGQLAFALHNSLAAFYPGNLALSGNFLDEAVETCFATHTIMKRLGAIPEGFHLTANMVHNGQTGFPLRPEHAESLYMLYRTTGDVVFLEMGKEFAVMLWTRTATRCGFSALNDCSLPPLDTKHNDAMESFVLAETLKYLYLLFDYDNVLHGKPTSDDEEDVPMWVFNTEGHPLPVRDEWRWWRRYATAPRKPHVVNTDDSKRDILWEGARDAAMAAYDAAKKEYGDEYSAWNDVDWTCPPGAYSCLYHTMEFPRSSPLGDRHVNIRRHENNGMSYQIIDDTETLDIRFGCLNRQPPHDFSRLTKGLFRPEFEPSSA